MATADGHLAQAKKVAEANARRAVRRATKAERRAAVESIIAHGDKTERHISIGTTTEWKRGRDGKRIIAKEFLTVSFHSWSRSAYDDAVRFTRDEALKFLGFSWRKLGL